MKQKILWLLFDIGAAALILLLVWVVDYKMPQKGIKAVTGNLAVETASQSGAENESPTVDMETGGDSSLMLKATGNTVSNPSNLPMIDQVRSTEDWHQKFADKFTDTVVATDTAYTSPNLSISLTYNSYDTGKLDYSNAGKHLKYGTKTSYVLADIYIGDISQFQTAFAQDTYGVGYSEKLSDMSDRMKSILAVNGDSYSNDRHKDNGTIIRNGVIYRNMQTSAETCVLNWDGTVDIYPPGQTDRQQLIQRGAYQSWIFGPSLLDDQGKAKTDFITWDYIRQSHPRTALGYYEPGHYCLLLVDGRQDSTRGMFLDEEAKIFEDLGCKAAYNLDGGHCSFVTYNGKVANHPYKPEHEVEDGIFILQ